MPAVTKPTTPTMGQNAAYPSCRIGGLQQEVSLFRTLLEEVLNEVPHGWGESFSESELAERIRDALEESTE